MSRVIFAIVVFFCFSSLLWAQAKNTSKLSNLPVHLTADRVSYNKNTQIYEAWGHVVLTQGQRHAVADYMKVDLKNRRAYLEGNVLLKAGKDWIKADRARLDLNTYQGVVFNAHAFFAENHFYVSGKRIKKTGKNTYEIEDANITTCDGASPAWHFSAKRIRVQLEGWASGRHIVFWAKSVPLLYTPYFILPIRTKRQTGFLFPAIGFSERDGTDVTLPFFWAIKPNIDATFYQRYMSKRGYMQGVEFRYALNPDDKGIFYFDYLDDTYNDPHFPEISQLGKRWWLRAKMNHLLPENVYTQMDLDLVSDQYYLKEFTEGFDNYRHCNREFLNYFHRGIGSDEDSLIRYSSISFTKNWTNYSLIGEFDYTQNLDKSQDEYTLQRLPQISFLRNDTPLFNSGLFLKWDSSYTYFWRPKGIKGQRLHFAPTVSFPYRNKYIELRPSFQPIETAYFTNEGNYFRFTYEPNLEAKTDLWKQFKWPVTFVHHLQPRIQYSYRPDVDQSQIPYFDGLDRLNKKNLITYSLTNYFLIQRDERLQEFIRLELRQSYDLNEARRHLPSGGKKRPFSNVTIDIQVNPLWGFYLDTEAELSPYGEGIRKAQANAIIRTKRGDYLNLNYEYLPNISRDLALETFLRLPYHWSVRWYSKRSFLYHQNIETRLGLRYQAQCWGVEFAYSDLYNDRKFMIIFNLTGIGDIKGLTFGRK